MTLGRRGFSTGFTWVFGLVSLFGLGVMYIVFSQVFKAHLVPIITDQIVNSPIPIAIATQNEIIGNINKYLAFFDALPFLLFGIIILYMMIAAIRKEREEQFF